MPTMVLLLLVCCNMPIFINYVNSIIEKMCRAAKDLACCLPPCLKMIVICQDCLVLSIV